MKKTVIALILGAMLLVGCEKSEETVITSDDALRVESLDEAIFIGVSRSVRAVTENIED